MNYQCFIQSCTSSSYDRGLKWSEFPQDEGRAMQWWKVLRDKVWEPVDKKRICSKHFVSGISSNDPLSEDFVPTLNLECGTAPVVVGRPRLMSGTSAHVDDEGDIQQDIDGERCKTEAFDCKNANDTPKIDNDAEKATKEMKTIFDKNLDQNYLLEGDGLSEQLGSSCDFKLRGNGGSIPDSVIIRELDGTTLIKIVRKYVSEMFGYVKSGQFGSSVIKPDINGKSGSSSVNVPGSESIEDIDSEGICEVNGESTREQDGSRITKQDSDIPGKQDDFRTSEKDIESDDDHSWITADSGEEVVHDDDDGDDGINNSLISYKETTPLAEKSDKEIITASVQGCSPLVAPVSTLQYIGDCKIHKSKIILYCSSCKVWACEYCLPKHDLKSQQNCLTVYASHAFQEAKEEMAGRGFSQIKNMKKLKDQLLKDENELLQLVSLMRKDLHSAEEKQEAILAHIRTVQTWMEKMYEEQISFLGGKTVDKFAEAKKKYTRLETESEELQKLIEKEVIDDVQKTKQVESWLETVRKRWETAEREVKDDDLQKSKQVESWLENIEGLGSLSVMGIERMRNKVGIMKSVYAVHKTDKKLLWGRLSIQDNFLLLHAFEENVPPQDAVLIPFEEVRKLASDYMPKTFMDLEWHNYCENQSHHESRVFYSLTGKVMDGRAWQFLLLCSGQAGMSYKNSTLYKSKWEYGVLVGGDYESKSGASGGSHTSVNCSNYDACSKVKFPGLVFGVSTYDSKHMGQFNIQVIKANMPKCATGFGKVEMGLTVLRTVYYSSSYSKTKVKDCGVVYNLF